MLFLVWEGGNMIARLTIIENQREYCRKTKLEYLLSDGYCPKCGGDIASWYIHNGYWGNEKYITFCPYCKEVLWT